jgi:hypothetical protein
MPVMRVSAAAGGRSSCRRTSARTDVHASVNPSRRFLRSPLSGGGRPAGVRIGVSAAEPSDSRLLAASLRSNSTATRRCSPSTARCRPSPRVGQPGHDGLEFIGGTGLGQQNHKRDCDGLLPRFKHVANPVVGPNGYLSGLLGKGTRTGRCGSSQPGAAIPPMSPYRTPTCNMKFPPARTCSRRPTGHRRRTGASG